MGKRAAVNPRIRALIEEAIVDAYTEDEQEVGFLTMMQDRIPSTHFQQGEIGALTNLRCNRTLSSCLWRETRAVGQVRIDRWERLTLVPERWTDDSDRTTATRSVHARPRRTRSRNSQRRSGRRREVTARASR